MLHIQISLGQQPERETQRSMTDAAGLWCQLSMQLNINAVIPSLNSRMILEGKGPHVDWSIQIDLVSAP